MKQSRGLIFVGLAIAAAAVVAGVSRCGGGERSLFNGRDLSGWEGDPRFWSVRDGAITGESSTANPTPRNTYLIWRGGAPKDFDLRVKWRIQGVDANSGIQFRSQDRGDWVVSGYQADIDTENRFTGIGYEELGRGVFARPGERVLLRANELPRVIGTVATGTEVRATIRPPGEWNEYRIVARGSYIVEYLNGQPNVEFTDEDESRRASEGILAFQLHSGAPTTVQFKDILLKAL